MINHGWAIYECGLCFLVVYLRHVCSTSLRYDTYMSPQLLVVDDHPKPVATRLSVNGRQKANQKMLSQSSESLQVAIHKVVALPEQGD